MRDYDNDKMYRDMACKSCSGELTWQETFDIISNEVNANDLVCQRCEKFIKTIKQMENDIQSREQ